MSSSVATPLQLYTNELLAIFANQSVFIGDVREVCCVQINFSALGRVHCPGLALFYAQCGLSHAR